MAIELNNKEFLNVWRLVSETRSSVFMTGRAGTGKSTFLRYIVENIQKKTVVLAPTGISAVNVGGVTLHSFFRIPLQPFALDDVNFSTPGRLKAFQKFNSEKIKLLQEVELIVIDEVSMVRADVLDFVDRVLRSYVYGGRNLPFGGKQLLLVGDAFQLEPVVREQDWDILRRFYQTPYFFGARVFQSLNLVQVELTKVYRQKESAFLSLLDKVRVGLISPQDLAVINSRVQPSFEPQMDRMYVTLTATRATCDFINDHHLAALTSEPLTYQGVIKGEFPESSLPTNKELTLKEGAQVVFIRNDVEHRWFNGTIGRIDCLMEDGIWVVVETGESDEDGKALTEKYFVENEIWENVRYRYNEESYRVETELLGTYTQLPVRLAWAITIHKSQGLTFDSVIIDLGRGAFACGQVYVALSRCRTLGGIVLRQPIMPSDIKTSSVVQSYSCGANDEGLISHQFDLARASSLYSSASDAFRERDFRKCIDDLFDALAVEPEVLKRPAARRLIVRRLGVINRLSAEIDSLLREKERQRQKNFEFAYEYYLMANECVHKFEDVRAAKANVNKSIALSPDYSDALILRAELCLGEGEVQQAVDDASAALRDSKISPKKRVAALAVRADAYVALRDWREAYLDLCDVLRVRPSKDKYRLMASVCDQLEMRDDAEAYRAKAEEDDDDD